MQDSKAENPLTNKFFQIQKYNFLGGGKITDLEFLTYVSQYMTCILLNCNDLTTNYFTPKNKFEKKSELNFLLKPPDIIAFLLWKLKK